MNLKRRGYIRVLVLALILAIFFIFITARRVLPETIATTIPDSTKVFRNYLTEYFAHPPGSKERTEILKQLKSHNRPFEEWLEIYNKDNASSELRAMVLDKLVESCSTYEECAKLWPLLPTEDDHMDKVFKKWLLSTRTVGELLDLYKKVRFSTKGNYEAKVRRDIMENYLDLPELVPVILYAEQNPELAKDLYQKLKKLKAPYEEWAIVCALITPESHIYSVVIEKMFDQMTSFKHGRDLYHQARGDEELEKKAVKAMVAKAETFEDKLALFGLVEPDSKEGKKLFEELLKQADSKEKLQALARCCSPGSSLEEKVLKKIKDSEKK